MNQENQVAAPAAPVDLFAELDTKSLANEGIEIEIMKPDGETSGLFIKVLGQDSDAYVKLKERQDRARMRAIAKSPGRPALDGLFDAGKDNEMDLIVACCVGWRHSSGRSMPFALGNDDPDATRDFFQKYPLVFDQVRVGIADRMNFTKAPAKR